MSASVALPVSANGVRSGIVYAGVVVTSGAWLPVGVMKKPRFWTGPPLTFSPAKPLAPVPVTTSDSRSMPANVPPNSTWKPTLSRLPSSRPAQGWTVTVAPAGMIACSAVVMPAIV